MTGDYLLAIVQEMKSDNEMRMIISLQLGQSHDA